MAILYPPVKNNPALHNLRLSNPTGLVILHSSVTALGTPFIRHGAVSWLDVGKQIEVFVVLVLPALALTYNCF